MKSAGPSGKYQKCKPVTDKNIGRNLRKMGGTKHVPNGTREQQRRVRQMERLNAKAT